MTSWMGFKEWRSTHFFARCTRRPWHEGQIVDIRELSPRSSVAGTLQHSLHPALEQALEEQRLLPLYAHQARTVDMVLDGQDVVVVTPAASGKSLCYNIPVDQALLEDPSSRALYLFPTKALAQDQRRGLRDLLPPTLRSRAAIFDGDTPHHERAALRRTVRGVLSNLDMLHLGMLPRHRSWARLLAGLQYVVMTRPTCTGAYSDRTWPTFLGAFAGSADATAAILGSSSARRPSPIPGRLPCASPDGPLRWWTTTALPTEASGSCSGIPRLSTRRRAFAAAPGARRPSS